MPNRNVNWSRCGSSSQWFEMYVQLNFTHHKLNCFVDLVCVFFCLFYIIMTAMPWAFFLCFFKRYTSPKFHWSWLPRWLSGKASGSRAEDPGFESRLHQDFFGVESYQWHKHWHSSGYPARQRVSTGTGRSGVSILWLGEMESLVCNFCLSVAACKIVWADPSLRYTHVLLGR